MSSKVRVVLALMVLYGAGYCWVASRSAVEPTVELDTPTYVPSLGGLVQTPAGWDDSVRPEKLINKLDRDFLMDWMLP